MSDETKEVTPEQVQKITKDVILEVIISFLEDFNVLLDLAEAYQVFPQEKIDKFRSNIDLSKM